MKNLSNQERDSRDILLPAHDRDEREVDHRDGELANRRENQCDFK
jgi:hypothetical protein